MSLFDATWSLQVEKLLPPVLRDADFVLNVDDFKPGEADNIYIQFILVSSPGHWKEYPLVGIGIFKYLQGTQSKQVLLTAIREQLEADIFRVPLINVSDFPTVIINKVSVTLE
jgi:hypothetical protein